MRFSYIEEESSYYGSESISQYCGSVTDNYYKTIYYIPSSLRYVSITGGRLYNGAFSNCSRFKSIIIGDGVTSISQYAFYRCSGLKNIIIPESVTSIGSSAFSGCSSLESMTLPFVGTTATGSSYVGNCFGYIFGTDAYSGVYVNQYDYDKSFVLPAPLKDVTITGGSIQSFAFQNCRNLTNIKISGIATPISSHAFDGCSSLTSITIPDGVTSIGDYAFYGCSGLTSITIPDGVTSIGDYAFCKCSGLTNFTLPVDSKIAQIDNYTFSGCSKLTKMQLPVSVTQIGDYAFQNCTALAEVKIPSSIYKVGTEAFKGCTSLNDVYTYTIEPQSIAQNTFATYGSATLHVPAVSYYNYYNTQWSRFLKLVNFDEPYPTLQQALHLNVKRCIKTSLIMVYSVDFNLFFS